ncbi:MAG TPA: 3-deoxy-D-manno-octulosonic acid transferase, partial [Aquabacterium sp.]|nr:3-deoxy-D-manno-octulosonic acid transferase [Aquabacterium sp.]
EQAGAARRVRDWGEGVEVATTWAGSAEHPRSVERCLAFAQAHRGAAEHMACLVVGVQRR